MKVIVVGASGNVGTSLLRAFADESAVDSVLGVARRPPQSDFLKTDWAQADISEDDLVPMFSGADCVVHLAWLIQPSHDLNTLWRTNVHGSRQVFRAVHEAGVPSLVYASSVGTYSPGPKDRAVDETWPTEGTRTSFYSRHKVEVERALDKFEREYPETRVVRLRPGFIFKREAASEIHRLFTGPLLPRRLVRRSTVPLFPDIPRLRFNGVHSFDVGDAYRRAVVSDARGAFNIAADPVLDAEVLSRVLSARKVRVPAAVARAAIDVSWRTRLQPTPPGWLDLARDVPLLDTTRARTELGWEPQHRADEAFLEVFHGLREGAGMETPLLEPKGD